MQLHTCALKRRSGGSGKHNSFDGPTEPLSQGGKSCQSNRKIDKGSEGPSGSGICSILYMEKPGIWMRRMKVGGGGFK